jgi:hypothetical protein
MDGQSRFLPKTLIVRTSCKDHIQNTSNTCFEVGNSPQDETSEAQPRIKKKYINSREVHVEI